MIRPTPTSTLFPYTTLFRSLGDDHREQRDDPEDRAAVDDDQQDQDEQRRRIEQRAVDLVEDVDRVGGERSEEHTSELQSLAYLVCRLLLEKKKKKKNYDAKN